MSDMNKHKLNAERVRQLSISAGAQNLFIEILDRLDNLEAKSELTWQYGQGTWREVYQLKEAIKQAGAVLTDTTDNNEQ